MNAKNKILLAVPSNDGVTIFEKMLGMAKYFKIFRIKQNTHEFEFIEIRENPYQYTQQHLKTFDVYSLINDCQIILAANIGKKGVERLKTKGVEIIMKKGNIHTALNEIIKNE